MYAYIIALKEEVAFWAEMLKACGQNEDTPEYKRLQHAMSSAQYKLDLAIRNGGSHGR